MGLERSGAALDQRSFADPECQVHSLDDNTVAPYDHMQKYRLLLKKEVSRRLNAQAAGMGYASEPSCCKGQVAARSIQDPRVATSTAAVIVSLQLPPLQVSARGALQLTSFSAAAVSGRQPPLQGTSIPSVGLSIPMTPKDLRILDYVLTKELYPGDPVAWVGRAITDLVLRALTRHFEYAAYPHGP